MLEYFRKSIKNTIGNAFVGDAFKADMRSSTEVVVKYGEAWYEGFPFVIKSPKDHLVSGNVLTSGILPTAVTIVDDPNGEGKLITFNDGGTTPTNNYSIVVSAEEEVITNVEDPFIKNANLTESTAQKVRVTYKLNVVPTSSIDEAPIPYTNDTSDQNLVNFVTISPTGSGPGDLISTNPLSGSEEVDGRNVEIVLRNDPGVGGRVLPNSSSDQERFQGGRLVDSVGNSYYITDIFNDATPTNIVLRLDKEVGQLDPTITNGTTYQVWKNDILHAEGSTGNPIGKIFVSSADIDWNSTDEIVHASRISDLRETTQSQVDFENLFNQKLQTIATMPGTLNWDATPNTEELQWTADFTLVNPYGNNNTISNNTVVIIDGGAIVYELNSSGGAIDKGNQVYNISSGGTTITLSGSPDLSDIRIGNVIRDSANTITYITSIDNVNDTLTVNDALVNGSTTVYKDSFSDISAPFNENSYVLFVRRDAGIWSDYAAALGSIQGLSADDDVVFDDSTNILHFNADGIPNTMTLQAEKLRVGVDPNPPILSKASDLRFLLTNELQFLDLNGPILSRSANNRLNVSDQLQLAGGVLLSNSASGNYLSIGSGGIEFTAGGPTISNSSGTLLTSGALAVMNADNTLTRITGANTSGFNPGIAVQTSKAITLRSWTSLDSGGANILSINGKNAVVGNEGSDNNIKVIRGIVQIVMSGTPGDFTTITKAYGDGFIIDNTTATSFRINYDQNFKTYATVTLTADRNGIGNWYVPYLDGVDHSACIVKVYQNSLTTGTFFIHFTAVGPRADTDFTA